MAMLDPCLFLQSDAHSARLFRALITEAYDEGVLRPTHLKVSERNAGAGGPNFSIDVAPGRGVVQGDSAAGNIPLTSIQGNYMCTNDAVTNVSVSSAPSAGNTRYDIVILEVKDSAEDAGGSNLPQLRVVAGTPATSGAVPPSLPVSSILLATIGPIVNSTTTISNSLITDGRTRAGRRCAVGTVEHLAGSNVPSGWLACDGSAVSRTTYADLFAEIGTGYGVGNGTTTFNLPDLRGKIPIARLSTQAQVDTVGETGGEYTHTMTSAELVGHTHTGPSHTHTINHDHPATDVRAEFGGARVGFIGGGATGDSVQVGSTSVGLSGFQVDLPSYSGSSGSSGTGSTGSAGSGSPFNVMQPYQVVGLAVIRT